MPDLKYEPVAHEHEAFLRKAFKRKGFAQAYGERKDEWLLARQLLAARCRGPGSDRGA
ncbi:MAG: hypothetical protein ABH877_01330 [bacterium]